MAQTDIMFTTTSQREKTGQRVKFNACAGWLIECLACNVSHPTTMRSVKQHDAEIEQWPCQGSNDCDAMLCDHCRKTCGSCGLASCESHLQPVDGDMYCQICRGSL